MVTAEPDLPHVLKVLFTRNVNIEKNLVLPIGKLPSPPLFRNAIMLQHLIIQFLPCYLSNGRLRSKGGRDRLKAVVAYKKFQM